MNSPAPPGTPSLYIHWPFCTAKCPYCDFNVHIDKTAPDESMWVKALLADLQWQLEGQALAPLQTIYFGGGTPSLLSPHAIAQLIAGALDLWPTVADPQITLEVHPTSADQAKFRDFRAAGVNRVSIGVQSFDATRLTFLGRDHSAQEAAAAVAHARHVFDALNLDLMTALPAMTLADQAWEIDQALDRGVDHLSVYQLGIEPGTAFAAAVRQGLWQPQGADQAADFFQAAIDQITLAGFDHYEVSNFAKPGFESQHSVLGWRGQGYVGIGPGAEGRAPMLAPTLPTTQSLTPSGPWRQRITRKSPSGYLTQVRQQGHGLDIDAPLGDADRCIEQLIFGLRLTAGLPLDAAAWTLCPPELIRRLIDSGDLVETPTHRRATDQGRLRLDALSDYLINYAR